MTWSPLEQIAYGFCIFPFSPVDVDQLSNDKSNPHQIQLETGDEIYAFEQIREAGQPIWYRGYVVSTSRYPLISNASQAQSLPTTVEEPQVSIGIFPSTHVRVRQMLPDAEGRLASTYLSFQSTLKQFPQRANTATLTKSPSFGKMETLEEEEEDEDVEKKSLALNDSDYTPIESKLSNSSKSNKRLPDSRPPPPLPSLKCGDETSFGHSEPLIDEIACALREYFTALHSALSNKDYVLFEKIKNNMNALNYARMQLLQQSGSDNNSKDDLVDLRARAVERLVKANVDLGLDVIVRHPTTGALANISNDGDDIDRKAWISSIRMYAQQVELAYINSPVKQSGAPISQPSLKPLHEHQKLSNLTEPLSLSRNNRPSTANQQGHSASSASDSNDFFHVYLNLRSFNASPCYVGETVELFFSLYSSVQGRFLTEDHVVVLDHNGLPVRRSDDFVCTLFRDLSKVDVSDNLYLVCKIIRNGFLKSPLNFEDTAGASTKKFLRRPFGCAVLDLGQLSTKSNKDMNEAMQYSMPIYVPSMTSGVAAENLFANLHQDIITNNYKVFDASTRATDISVTVKAFHGAFNQMLRDHSGVLLNVPTTARLGFSDAVFPSDIRNDLYCKLWSGDFTSTLASSTSRLSLLSNTNSNTSKNIQVSVEARRKDGSRIEDCFTGGTGDKVQSVWDFSVFANNSQPTWGEMVKLTNVSAQEFLDVHLFFTIRNKSSKDKDSFNVSRERIRDQERDDSTAEPSFAWGYLPIFNEGQAFLPDASHTLQLFKCFGEPPSASVYLNNTTPTVAQSGKKERVFSGGSLNGECRDMRIARSDSLPGSVNGNSPLNTPDALSSPGSPSDVPRLRPLRDSISIRTFLCSTLFTQNPVLLKLLSWERERSYQTQSAADIESVLSQLPFVGEPEIVKFLAETFDAIFGIMASSANEGDRFDPLLFNALIKVLAIIQDRRFSQFETVLDVYINENFVCGPASSHLIRSLQRLLAKPSDPSTAQQLHAALKVLPFLIRFIVRSREIQREKSAGLDITSEHLEDTFKKELVGVLDGLVKLMEITSPSSVIGTQTLALRHFAGCLPSLERIFPSEELVEHVMAFAEACKATKGKLVVYILLNYLHIVRSGLFDKPGTRTILVPTLIRLVKPHLGPYDEYQHVKSKDSDSARDAARVDWIERLRLSVTILATMLDKLHVAVVDPVISASRTLSRQEEDNVEDIFSLLPKLLESYHELNSDALIDAITKHKSPSTTIASIPTVFPATYPFSLLSELPQSLTSSTTNASTSLSLARNNHFNCGLGEIASVILVMIQLLPPKLILDFLTEHGEVEGEKNQTRFLTNIFSFSIGVLDYKDSGIDEKLIPCPYPKSWLNISLFAHRMVLKLGKAVSYIMERQYVPSLDLAGNFNRNLWRVCFEMYIRLLASKQLVIEEHTPQKRRAVWKLAGDLRGEGAKIFSVLWNAIGWPEKSNDNPGNDTRFGGYQIQFPDLVADLLELCLSHHDELRNQAVGILHSMIVSEHLLNGHFEGIEAEIIDKLDKLFMDGTKGDEISRAFFVSELRSLFNSSSIDENLQKNVSRFLDSVDYFLELLLSIRNLPDGEEYEDDRLEATLKLMTFIRNLREEIYVKYLHALVHMHLRSNAYAEAGMTLKLHADMYSWDSSVVLEPLSDLNLPKQTSFQRRETLLAHCMEYLAAGKAYEVAIDVCKDLAHQYENKTYDFHKLADILTYQASLVDSIMKGDREFPEFFRVAYHGGFPPALKNKQFVYRGLDHEHIDAFCKRMEEKHPSAQVLSGNQIISQEIADSDEQYLSIASVTPEVDRTSPIIQNPNVAEPIRKYYENNTDLFSYTRTLDKDYASSSVSLEGEWMEKTLLQCESQFPYVMRRSEIIETRTIEVSPIDLALEEVEMMRQEMSVVNSKFEAQLESRQNKKSQGQQNLRVEALSMVLNNACDIPVDAGVCYYRSTYLARKDDNPSSQRLEKGLINLAMTIRKGLDIHKSICTSEMARFHMTLEKLFVRNYSKEIAQFPNEISSDVNGGFSRSSSFKSFSDKQKRHRNLSTVTGSSSVNTSKSSKPTLSLPKLSSLKSMSKQRSSPSLDYKPTSPKSPTSSVKSWTPRLHRSKSKSEGPPQLSLGKFDEEGFSRLFSKK
ncbi:hypothetical protein E3P99_02368 [Wallemia hederae]|uniref:Uncharacterized protein n=1 Tax=Wallemia hederae TaxID=1540922 RepID=A0A4T0FKH3_9BASI|nr:hypothetical protein E3P99_02368 [Wallemia hederae]